MISDLHDNDSIKRPARLLIMSLHRQRQTRNSQRRFGVYNDHFPRLQSAWLDSLKIYIGQAFGLTNFPSGQHRRNASHATPRAELPSTDIHPLSAE
jgi:hypothetical protein